MMRKIIAPIFCFCFVLSGAFNSKVYGDFRSRLSGEVQNEYSGSDVEEEFLFGTEVAARILGKYELFNNKEANKFLNLVGRTIAKNSSRPEIEFRFAVINTSDINAYSTPGGYIFITKGALNLMKNEAELAGVLAHEIAHITERHIVKELNIKGSADSPMAGFARLIGGGTEAARSVFIQAVNKAMDILFKDGYKRADEEQSDKIAVLLCALSGYNPEALKNYLERISSIKNAQGEAAGKTHPVFEERLTLIDNAIKVNGINVSNLAVNKERFQKVFVKNKLY